MDIRKRSLLYRLTAAVLSVLLSLTAILAFPGIAVAMKLFPETTLREGSVFSSGNLIYLVAGAALLVATIMAAVIYRKKKKRNTGE